MTIKEKNQIVYRQATEYLKSVLPQGIQEKDLEKYYLGDDADFKSLEDVFVRLIKSAQNYQVMPNVIKFDDRIKCIKDVLCGFDYKVVAEMHAEDLYHAFRRKFNVASKDSKMNCWYKWSKSIVDAAEFISKFKDIDDFKHFISLYDYNTMTRMSLPLLISSEINGIGFPLACDFLKELGYLNYPKPDVHIVEIFSKLGFSSKNPLDVYKALIRMYEDCKEIDSSVTPYKIDKILWLISTGDFYYDKGVNGSRYRDDFIEEVKKILNK